MHRAHLTKTWAGCILDFCSVSLAEMKNRGTQIFRGVGVMAGMLIVIQLFKKHAWPTIWEHY